MATLKIHSIGYPFKTENINISQGSIRIRVNTITGKDGDFWVCISPSINVSGYGDTADEAQESFKENVELFHEDLFKLKLDDRMLELKKLGWFQKKFFKKQFSKAFVDENGILKNLTNVQLNSLESVA